MSKKGKRLREFEKNNRVFNIEEARKKREEKYKDRRSEKAAQAAYLQDMGPVSYTHLTLPTIA